MIDLMKWHLYTVGKPALAYARTGMDEYIKRLRRYTTIEHHILRRGDATEVAPIVGGSRETSIHIVLDERGQDLTSTQLSERLQQWQLDAVKRVCCFIGGADGHGESIRERADLVLRLSSFTLQHELAAVVLLEQIYRAHTILRNEPYHR